MDLSWFSFCLVWGEIHNCKCLRLLSNTSLDQIKWEVQFFDNFGLHNSKYRLFKKCGVGETSPWIFGSFTFFFFFKLKQPSGLSWEWSTSQPFKRVSKTAHSKFCIWSIMIMNTKCHQIASNLQDFWPEIICFGSQKCRQHANTQNIIVCRR